MVLRTRTMWFSASGRYAVIAMRLQHVGGMGKFLWPEVAMNPGIWTDDSVYLFFYECFSQCFVRLSAVHTAEISSSCHLDIGTSFFIIWYVWTIPTPPWDLSMGAGPCCAVYVCDLDYFHGTSGRFAPFIWYLLSLPWVVGFLVAH